MPPFDDKVTENADKELSCHDPADGDLLLVPSGIVEADVPVEQREKQVQKHGREWDARDPFEELLGRWAVQVSGRHFQDVRDEDEDVGEADAEPVEVAR